eukprot:CAMPEP_0178404742 /NCGR_PEP_ID=MMETSP0689_2-20121128/18044_1 /TAXON_ID=160604 /ORGANISM="Amphidinium massartii, Strain CS-259" /LENGTH=103 /DNA_ID=CAMNT_0020025743 /DNA_START=77 /DNA_END=388 /DNA_ORIENTATION=+
MVRDHLRSKEGTKENGKHQEGAKTPTRQQVSRTQKAKKEDELNHQSQQPPNSPKREEEENVSGNASGSHHRHSLRQVGIPWVLYLLDCDTPDGEVCQQRYVEE